MQLNELADPNFYTNNINVSGYSHEKCLVLLKQMLTIRTVEQEIATLVRTNQAKCPCHLAVGQEAIAVGVATQLTNTDRAFGNHRSHAHYLALGGSVYRLFAEVLGRVDGCSGGIGGSMHLIDQSNGFLGSVPIVAATIPLAAGAALAAKLKGEDSIGVCFFGDGATEEGSFHETLNLASKHKLPMIFVCENNLYSSHLDITQRQPGDSMARFAKANYMDFNVVDGNDVIAVAEATKNLVDKARNGMGPVFLEAITYRWLGHVGPDENIDVGIRRSMEDLAKWKQRDPIKRLADSMIINGWITQVAYHKAVEDINLEVKKALESANQSPYPNEDKLLYKVYS